MAESKDKNLPASKKCTVISCPIFLDDVTMASPIVFYDFPSIRAVAKVWKEKCGIAADHNTTNCQVCNRHFRPEDFTDGCRKQLKDNAVPRDHLDWMLGAPAIIAKPKHELLKIGTVNPRDYHPRADIIRVDIQEAKQVVDDNELRKKHVNDLQKEQAMLEERNKLYDKKLVNVEKEIFRLTCQINKMKGHRPMAAKLDANLISKIFSPAQIDMLYGKKKVTWSYDDMARAFTLRHIGNKECYLYLKNTLNMPLPSLSSVQKWAASNKQECD